SVDATHGEIGPAGRSVRSALRDARARRAAAGQAGPAPRTAPAASYDPYRITLPVVELDRDEWHACAARHEGTSNTLFTALVCGIVRRSGYPVDGQLRVSVAVSKRGGADDRRANASGGVWLRIEDTWTWPGSLTQLRAHTRKILGDYARTGTDIPDDVTAIARLLPRRALRTALDAVPSPDVSVSNLGVLPEKIRTLFGTEPSRFLLRLIVVDSDGAGGPMPGPALSAWVVEYGDRVMLSFAGFNPEHFGDDAVFREIIAAELTAWGLGHRFA
ncbi:MAG: hypothetical protein QM662_18360, partial [Gordonia sp. (in: high G+C Gram-positive bacteria)]